MKIAGAFAVVALTVATMAGCSALDHKTGTQISQETLNSFTKGKTRREDVIAAIGQPPRKSEVMGKEVWNYTFTRIAAMPFQPNEHEDAVFEFDKKGVLLNAYKTSGSAGQSGNALLDAAGM